MTSRADLPFESLYRHGFARVGVAVPRVHLAEPERNGAEILRLAETASQRGACLVVFPELCLSGYSLQDLFHQQAIVEASEEALLALQESSRELAAVVVVGLPLQRDGKLFSCAAVLHRGEIVGVVPKAYLPNYREFYEARHFARGHASDADSIRIGDRDVPFGSLSFRARSWPAFHLFVEICEDLWVPLPPSTFGALAGATILCNLSASNVTIAKSEYRETLCRAQSGRCISAYLYAGAGFGESTTDLAWDSHGMIWENAVRLAETERFAQESQLALADVDLERLLADRLRMTSYVDSQRDHADRLTPLRTIDLDLEPPPGPIGLEREIERFPYVPADPARRDERCEEVYNIQVQGLAQRLHATGIRRLVIGVSGGLDSTQALLVAARTCDLLELPRTSVLAYTMPGPATSDRTLQNARRLMEHLGVSAGEIDITEASRSMLERIGHPAASGEPVYDVTYENVQAGERTSHLFRLANLHEGLVVGTGDLSELALGWCTYGVGDQMSHYNVNASVPKTLVRHLVHWVARSGGADADTAAVLESILATEISPELVPGSGAEPAQLSEEAIGPYELQDFHLYQVSRFGFRPSKVAYLCHRAWGDRDKGAWPADLAEDERREYGLATIKHWLGVFLERFFGRSQFKRSALPDGPKVGSGGSLSPRGDWRAPSDASAAVWLEELRRNVP